MKTSKMSVHGTDMTNRSQMFQKSVMLTPDIQHTIRTQELRLLEFKTQTHLKSKTKLLKYSCAAVD